FLDSKNRVKGTFGVEEIAGPVNIPEVILRAFIDLHFHVDGLAIVIINRVSHYLGITVTSRIIKGDYAFFVIFKVGLNVLGGIENIQADILIKKFLCLHPGRIVFFSQVVFWFSGENFSYEGAVKEETRSFMRTFHPLLDLAVGEVLVSVNIDAVDLDL